MTNVSPLFPDMTAQPAQFDKFWSWVPRKVGKKAARKAWDKALGEGTDPQSIIDGTKRWHSEWRARLKKGDDLSYCPHPSTWLNAGRWEDEDGILTSPDETHSIVAMSDLSGPLADEWQAVLVRLHDFDSAACATWFAPLKLISYDINGAVTLKAPSAFFASRVRDHWLELIARTWGRTVKVQ